MRDYSRLAPAKLGLNAQHAEELLGRSAIAPEVVLSRGWCSVVDPQALSRSGFKPSLVRPPGLLVPLRWLEGAVVGYQYKPDHPRRLKGKLVKYENPKGGRVHLDVPVCVANQLGDSSIPLFITEGAKKADAAASQGLCCISLIGVDAWRRKDGGGVSRPLPEWDDVSLSGRSVYIAFDSDAMVKESVRVARERLTEFLRSRGALVSWICLPHEESAEDPAVKVGLDDYFADGHTLAELLSLAREPEHDFWSARDWLSWCDRTGRARGASREALLGVLLARTAAEVSPQVRIDSPIGANGTGLEMFCFLVGESGTTKTLANSIMRRARDWSAQDFKPGSGEGLAAAYMEIERVREEGSKVTESRLRQYCYRRYAWIDEYGSVQAVKQRAGQTLGPELRSAWSGERLGFDYRSRETRLPVEAGSYRLGIAAGIQPQIAGEVFKGAEVGDLQRWVWFSTTDEALGRGRGDFTPLTDAEWAVPATVRRDFVPDELLAGKDALLLSIPGEVAAEVWADHIARQRGEVHNHDAHRNQTRLRVAGICALLDGRLAVSSSDWRLAGEILRRSDHNRRAVEKSLRFASEQATRRRGRDDELRNDAAETARIERVAARCWGVVKRHTDAKRHESGKSCTQACASQGLDTATRGWIEPALVLAEERQWLHVEHGATHDSVKGDQPVVRLTLGPARPEPSGTM